MKAMFSSMHVPDPVQFTAPTQESLYLIVAFDEGTSGPVAREWFTGKYDGGMAWWPPYKDSYKILQSVLKRTPPNPSKGWKQFSRRVLHETNCFESVSKRWGLSCHTSDLNTDKEELPAVRQRKKPSRLRSPSPPSSPASCPSSDAQNAPQKKKKKTQNKPSKKIPPPPPLLPMAGNNSRAVTNGQQPPVAHQRSKPMSVRRKLAHPPTSRLTPPAHPTSSYSEMTPDNDEGLLQQPPCHPLPELLQRTNDMITSMNEDLLTELTTVNWQQEAEYGGLGSPELPQDDWQHETPSDEGMCSPELSHPDLPHRIPQMSPPYHPDLAHRIPESQRFPRSAPAGCTAVERLLLEQVGELQLKMDYVIKLLQKNNSVQHDDFNLNMLPLLTLQDLEKFEEKLRTNSTFKKKVITKLSLSGGKNLKETVWRICAKIFHQRLATQLNWCGRGQKTGIKSRPVHHVLLSAVLKDPAQQNSSEADVEMAMRNWQGQEWRAAKAGRAK